MKVIEGDFDKKTEKEPEPLCLGDQLAEGISQLPDEMLEQSQAKYCLLVYSGSQFIVSSSDSISGMNLCLDLGKDFIMQELKRT